MAHYPPTHLVLEQDISLLVSGYHFHVLNPTTGDLLQSTATFADDVLEKLRKSGPIRCVAVDAKRAHITTTGDDKKLKVWSSVTDNLQLVNERELPKKPTEVSFTQDGQTIVVSDKFGDVFSYPLHPEPLSMSSSEQASTSKRGSLTSHENPSNGTLILGHASMLTTFLLTPDERYIVTADRDEHIRVSWYPQGYNIERYCLGHEKFVSALHIPSFQPSTLVSGGGDPMLKVWDWMSGKLLASINVFPTVEPYIKVKAPKRRRGGSDGDGDGEGEGGEGEQKKGKGRGRRNRGKGKGKNKEEAREDSADVEEAEATEPKANEEHGDSPMPDAAAQDPGKGDTQASSAAPEEVLVFVAHRISSVDRGKHGRFIIFNAVGATALFYTALPAEGKSNMPVHTVEFGVPVSDFTVGPNGDVWALLDAEWSDPPSAEKPQFVRLLTWDGATLSEATSSDSKLLASLNSNCLVPATPEDLKALDLYSDLSSMPKNVDPEHDPLIRDTLSEAAAVDLDTDGKGLTQRELGRLKKKKALLAKIQEKEQQKRGASEVAETQAEAGREVKRTRSESGEGDGKDKEAVYEEDVEMK
ncbi:WD40 repeat-like protein [Lentinus tigrinus ALCF2SS1-7]|uniref:WD40 repeat-like protein n=1 Tax=Lentinus tigrinus ALCF2SS1-7 TaxID=1328758 RepID=UPI0011663DFB|nr:WD40 repeat-like protein [Lentinus tigrinus ALCF2SS1-7]